jgi:hypothetical protein
MVRAIGGVALGYVVMVAIVFVAPWVAYLAIGADRAYQPGSYEVTGLWLVVSLATGIVAALAGGFVCAAVTRSARAAMALAGLVLVLGFAMAAPVLLGKGPQAQARTAEVGYLKATMKARQPAWVVIVTPLIGAAGALLAGRLGSRGRPPESVL